MVFALLAVTACGRSGPGADAKAGAAMPCSSLAPAADEGWRGHTVWDFRPQYPTDQTYCVARDGSAVQLIAPGGDPGQTADQARQFALATREGDAVAMVDAAGVFEAQYGNRPQRHVLSDGSGTTVVVPATVPPLYYGAFLLARRGDRYVRLSVISHDDESITRASFDLSGAVEVAERLLAADWQFPGCESAGCRSST